jgi:hypothetical protein
VLLMEYNVNPVSTQIMHHRVTFSVRHEWCDFNMQNFQ